MNKQELINKYKELWNEHSSFYEPIPYTSMVELFLKELKQLDEPQPVKVPQFVADWIEVCKEHLTSSLYLAMTPSFLKSNNQGIELTLWIKKNEETFARAWLDGYEVEKEKLYFVKITAAEQYLVRVEDENFLGFLQSRLKSKFTPQTTRRNWVRLGLLL